MARKRGVVFLREGRREGVDTLMHTMATYFFSLFRLLGQRSLCPTNPAFGYQIDVLHISCYIALFSHVDIVFRPRVNRCLLVLVAYLE